MKACGAVEKKPLTAKVAKKDRKAREETTEYREKATDSPIPQPFPRRHRCRRDP